jgi:threonine dehydratase
VEHPSPTIADVRAASDQIAGLVVRTPLVESPDLDARVGRRVLLKLETLQRTGSFKYRGAMTFLTRLGAEGRANGVAAYSSGNHAQAVAAAAAHYGVSATIVMPSDAPATKKAGTRARGAEIVEYDRASDDRVGITAAIAADTGAAVIPPYEHPWTISGQGSCGLEIAEQCRALGVESPVVLVPTGGGGLTAGIALALSEDLRMQRSTPSSRPGSTTTPDRWRRGSGYPSRSRPDRSVMPSWHLRPGRSGSRSIAGW